MVIERDQTDQDYKCLIKCVLERLGVYDVANNCVTQHRIKHTLKYSKNDPRGFETTKVEMCPTRFDDGDFDCDTAYDLYLCLYLPNNFVFVDDNAGSSNESIE